MTGPQGMGPLRPIAQPFVGDGVQNFSAIGAFQTLVVPTGVTTMEFELYGGGGMDAVSGVNNLGGKGGKLRSRHITIPGETLRFYVGQVGLPISNSAFNGGGRSAGGASTSGGGGGGGTDVRRSPYGLADRLAVAGGGGGAGAGFPNGQANTHGGDGAGNGTGDAGQPGAGGALAAAGGGQLASGGTAGASGGTWSGVPTAGAIGVGGNSGEFQGGGGGGGLYGGGGGSGNVSPGSGGGGSGGLPGLGEVMEALKGVRTGNGLAIVRWNYTGTVFLEDFNHADGSISSYGWEIKTGSGTATVATNKLSAGGSMCILPNPSDIGVDDYVVECDINPSNGVQLAARITSDVSSARYTAEWNSASGGSYIIRKHTTITANTVLASSTGVGTPTNPSRYRLKVALDVITLYIWTGSAWSSLLTVTDPTDPYLKGKGGLSSTAAAAGAWDNFRWEAQA